MKYEDLLSSFKKWYKMHDHGYNREQLSKHKEVMQFSYEAGFRYGYEIAKKETNYGNARG